MSRGNDIIDRLLRSDNRLDREFLRQDFVGLSLDEFKTVESRLIDLLMDEGLDVAIRVWIPSFLGPIRSDTVHKALISRIPLENSDTVRYRIIENLIHYFNSDESVNDILKQLEIESLIDIKTRIIHLLGESSNELAIPKLIELLDDPYDSVRSFAAQALGQIRSIISLEPLVKRLNKEWSDIVGVEIINAIVAVDGPNVVPTLIALLRDDKKSIIQKRVAALSLGNIASNTDEEVIQILLEYSCSSDRIMTYTATDAMIKLLGNEDAALRLAKFGLLDNNANIIPQIANAIRLVGDKKAIEYLNSVKDPSKMDKAHTLMEHIGGPEAMSVLVETRIEALNKAKSRVEEFDQQGLTIFQDTIVQAKRGFSLNLLMSEIIFIVGIFLLCFSIYLILQPTSNNFNLLFGASSGLTGIGTILMMFYHGPSERINRAVTNLVQIEIAFLGYIRQVTQIMAMFEREYLNDDFNIDELIKLLDYIENTLKVTMPLVHEYTVNSSPDKDK